MPVKKIVFYVMCAILAIMIIVSGITIGKVSALVQGILNPESPATESTSATADSTEQTDATDPTETTPSTNGPTDPDHQHSYSEYQTSPATCTEEGYTLYKCSCGDIETRDVAAALGHSYGAGQVISSCTEENYTKYECSRCGHVDKRNITPASGHNFSITEHFDATCEEDAYTVRKCSNMGCSESETEFLTGTSLGGHDFSILKEEVEATCTENGYKLYTCANPGCTAAPYKEEIPTTGHLFAQWKDGANGKESTCGKDGCNTTILASQLKITNAYQNGSNYIIIVGTGTGTNDLHRIYSYTIMDNRSQEERNTNKLTYGLDPELGLVVEYIDAQGGQQKIPLGFTNDSLSIEEITGSTEAPSQSDPDEDLSSDGGLG